MDPISKTFIMIGAILLFAPAIDAIGHRTKLPRVTLLLLFGLLIGPYGLDLLPALGKTWFQVATDLALLMIGFLLGEKLAFSFLKKNARAVLWISVGEVLVTAAIMFAVLFLIGVPIEVALILSGIAPASAPAATVDVVHEVKAKGKFTNTLLAIVAIDDALGLIVFSILFAFAQSAHGQSGSVEVLLAGAWELGGALVIGIALGVPMAYLTGRIRPGKPTLPEAIGFVLVCGGVALFLNVSIILASMVLGGVVANLAQHHERPFHAIENIESPFMILFFVLAGASLHVDSLTEVGLIGGAYIILRVTGQISGASAGAIVGNSGPLVRKYMGLALMPQAGVALGMALVAANKFPEIGGTIFPIVTGTTILFELIGPIMTRMALERAGEIPREMTNV
jgi:Kef-type K+ transport system membrane component KefB